MIKDHKPTCLDSAHFSSGQSQCQSSTNLHPSKWKLINFLMISSTQNVESTVAAPPAATMSGYFVILALIHFCFDISQFCPNFISIVIQLAKCHNSNSLMISGCLVTCYLLFVHTISTDLHCSSYQQGLCHQTSLFPKLKDKL